MAISKSRAKHPKPELEEKAKERGEWALYNLTLAPSSPATAEKNESVIANLFKLKVLPGSNVPIRKYRIELDTINKKPITKPEVRGALIKEILLYGRKPDATLWVCDWYKYIICVGKLWSGLGLTVDNVEDAYLVKHKRQAPPGKIVPDMESLIVYEGEIDWNNLKAYVNPKTPNATGYHPDEDLKALNLLSRKNIHDHNLQLHIATVGKKFYPMSPPIGRDLLNEDDQLVYRARTGFFTSVRPGDGSLLLNVNATTSAFYPSMVLQTWIERRLGTNKLQLETGWRLRS